MIKKWNLWVTYESEWLDQCWTGDFFFLCHSGNEDFTFSDTSRVWVFEYILVSDTIGVYMQEPSYPGKITLVSIWFRIMT